MNTSGILLLVLVSLSAASTLVMGQRPQHHKRGPSKQQQQGGGQASWFTMVSCLANQVPKLPEDFNKPLYQYLFETFARNTHLLPLGVPIHSKSEDFESTAEFETCLWGKTIIRERNFEENELNNDIDAETKSADSAYTQLFASRQGGYDSLTGFSLLGGKIVAAFVGYIIYALTGSA